MTVTHSLRICLLFSTIPPPLLKEEFLLARNLKIVPVYMTIYSGEGHQLFFPENLVKDRSNYTLRVRQGISLGEES